MIRDPASIAVDTDALVCQVADRFTEELKQGLSPDIEQYAQQHSQIAHIIRQVFPALAIMGDGSSTVQPEVEAGGHSIGVLGDFRILREIGRGGMGVVYEAEQVSLGRRVALKVLPFAAVLDERQLARFKNEARAAAALHHTNIVPVFSVGCERGVHYYAMQYIEGHTLAGVITQLRGKVIPSESPRSSSPIDTPTEAFDSASPELVGTSIPLPPGPQPPTPGPRPLTPDRDTIHDAASTIISDHSINSPAYYRTVARLGIQASEALEHAHQHGVIHRDIKPANLMLDAAGNLWIADFGLARLETDAGMTMTGDLVGTLRYMSPEQALGKRVVIDHRTDIYSLGVTLYELLALEAPFNGADRAAILRRLSFDEPARLRRLARAIPPDLETIVHKAMAKNPEERYTTAQALADDLRQFTLDKPIQAKPPSLLVRTRKWARRHKPVVATAACFAILALVGAGVMTALFYRQQAENTARAELIRQTDSKFNLAVDAYHRASEYARQENVSGAQLAFQDALASLAKIREDNPENLNVEGADLKMRVVYHHYLVEWKRDDEANEVFRAILADYSRIDLSNTRYPHLHDPFLYLGTCFFHMGESHVLRGDDTKAATFFAHARDCFAREVPDYQDGQARCLIEWGKCLDRQQEWEQSRRVYWQALPLLEDCYTTFHTQPRQGAWAWTPYPNMLMNDAGVARAVRLNVVCDLQLAIVYQRLQLNWIARLQFNRGRDYTFDKRNAPPHTAELAILAEGAALLDLPDYFTLDGAPSIDGTFAMSLLKPVSDLLQRAEESRRQGDPSGAYAQFDAAVRHAESL